MGKSVKKAFNVEYELNSEDFKASKMEEVSQRCQAKHGDNVICKVTTFCVPDHQLIVHTTEENKDFMGASSVLLANRPLAEQSFLTMDDDMVKTWEITITADTSLPDYVTALNVAQAKADDMFAKDDSKIPLVTVIDYRWGNDPKTISASLFTTTDDDGNAISLVGNTDSAANVVVGDAEAGAKYLTLAEQIAAFSDELKAQWAKYDWNRLTDLEKLRLYISFGLNVTDFDISNITDMSNAISYRINIQDIDFIDEQKNNFKTFNQDISGWDVSNVTNMSMMFYHAEAFNQDISKWDVSNVTNMYMMFYHAEAFNQDISGWDVSNVTDMYNLFMEALVFNQDITSWQDKFLRDDEGSVLVDFGNFRYNSALSDENTPQAVLDAE